MRRFLRSFRRLRWKLTASYTLVTVTTLLVLQLVILVAGLIVLIELADDMPRQVVGRLSDELAPQVSPYLEGETPDLAGIHGWLQDAGQAEITAVDSDLTGMGLRILDHADERTRLLLLDAEGRVLGDSRNTAVPSAPVPLDGGVAPGLENVLPRALQGEGETSALYELTGSGRLTFAVPVRDGTGRVVGALALSGPLTPAAVAFGIGSVTVVAVSAVGMVLFTVAAGLVGTVLGFFTARGLTRRLDRVTAAAVAWSAGDFSRKIRDRSADELGQLGRHLDLMAADLEDLLQARQQLSAAEERNRLARDLHDSVKQQVFAIGMNLAAARALWEQDPAAARGRLDVASDLVRLSQQELTSVIQTLRPVQLEGKGLCRALAEHVERWRGQTGIAAEFEARGEASPPPAVEEALFRVAQEALSNVARHSHASEVLVALTAGREETMLLVDDNGRGFDARGPSGGVGLHSMRERVEALGGHLRMESGAAGTTVVARIPAEGGRKG